METIILILFVVLFIIAIIEFIIKFLWVKEYYSLGINLYERKLLLHNDNLSELFARLKDGMPNTGLLNICFHISNNYDYILFRDKYINLFQIRSLLHGRIFQEDDQFRIIGYVRITTILLNVLFFILILGLIIIYSNNSNNYLLVIAIMFIPIIIAFSFLFLNYVITKNYLDKI